MRSRAGRTSQEKGGARKSFLFSSKGHHRDQHSGPFVPEKKRKAALLLHDKRSSEKSKEGEWAGGGGYQSTTRVSSFVEGAEREEKTY